MITETSKLTLETYWNLTKWKTKSPNESNQNYNNSVSIVDLLFWPLTLYTVWFHHRVAQKDDANHL